MFRQMYGDIEGFIGVQRGIEWFSGLEMFRGIYANLAGFRGVYRGLERFRVI